jgi:hypothetical protein
MKAVTLTGQFAEPFLVAAVAFVWGGGHRDGAQWQPCEACSMRLAAGQHATIGFAVQVVTSPALPAVWLIYAG